MSLERGTTLWRLNQELLPEPGSPMASTTTPFGARAAAVGAAGTLGVATDAAGASASPASGPSSSESTGVAGTAPLTAVGAKACATACSRPRPPRPLPPRRRRLRAACPPRPATGGEPADCSPDNCSSGSALARCPSAAGSKSGGVTGSETIWAVSTGSGCGSASK